MYNQKIQPHDVTNYTLYWVFPMSALKMSVDDINKRYDAADINLSATDMLDGTVEITLDREDSDITISFEDLINA